MSGEPENILLHYLRRIDGRLDTIVADIGDIKLRLQSLEEQFAGVRVDIARIDLRLDRLDGRMARVEGRLGLVEA